MPIGNVVNEARSTMKNGIVIVGGLASLAVHLLLFCVRLARQRGGRPLWNRRSLKARRFYMYPIDRPGNLAPAWLPVTHPSIGNMSGSPLHHPRA